MFKSVSVERIFASAWEKGYICQEDWEILLSNLADENAQILASRLMHAIRRGRLKIVD